MRVQVTIGVVFFQGFERMQYSLILTTALVGFLVIAAAGSRCTRRRGVAAPIRRLPERASVATRRPTSAGRRRGWRTSCGIPNGASRGDPPGFLEARSAADVHADDIAFVYGSKWKQRYFTKVGDDYFPLPAQWDVTHKVWRPYMVAAEHRLVGAALSGRQHEAADRAALRRLPLGELQRRRRRRSPSGTSAARSATAPAASTSRSPSRANIVNPARLDYVQRQRHLHPVPLAGAAAEESDRRAVLRLAGRLPSGRNLKDFWKLEEHKLGETTFTHFADGTAHKNRMQGNDFVQSADVHARRHLLQLPRRRTARANNADLLKPAKRAVPDLPRPELAERSARGDASKQHTHHAAGSAGSECVACHMPKIEQTIADVNVRSHTFRVHHAGDDRRAEDSRTRASSATRTRPPLGRPNS